MEWSGGEHIHLMIGSLPTMFSSSLCLLHDLFPWRKQMTATASEKHTCIIENNLVGSTLSKGKARGSAVLACWGLLGEQFLIKQWIHIQMMPLFSVLDRTYRDHATLLFWTSIQRDLKPKY